MLKVDKIVCFLVIIQLSKTWASPDQFGSEDGGDLTGNGWLKAELFEGDIKGRQFDNDFDPNDVQLWSGGLIPFDISEDLDVLQAIVVGEAIEELSRRTCLKFVPAKQYHTDKIVFVPANSNSEGCSSFVGRISGTQKIQVAQPCASKSAILHLILHSLGFWHENSRNDRGDLVEIVEENIRPEHRKHFRKYTDKERHHEGEPYDLQSVLHLPMNAFAIEPERQSMRIRNGPGQRTLTSDEGLSNSDVRKIRQRYCQGWSDAAISAEVEMQLNDQPATVENSTSTNNVTDKKKKKDEEDKKNASDERKEKEKERRREEQRRKSEVEKKKKKGRGKRIADNQQESIRAGKRVDRATDRKKKAKKSRSRERASHSQHGHTHTHHHHHVSVAERKGKKSEFILATRKKRSDSWPQSEEAYEQQQKADLERVADMERRWAEGDEEEKRRKR